MEEIMYHGTSCEKYFHILKSGAITDVRYGDHKQSVWLTTDFEVAKRFAIRSIFSEETPLVLVINTKLMKENNMIFYNTFNGINWQTDDIPCQYIIKGIKI